MGSGTSWLWMWQLVCSDMGISEVGEPSLMGMGGMGWRRGVVSELFLRELEVGILREVDGGRSCS